MRISDWSSDVCSSDLPLCDLLRVLLGIFWGRRQICQQNQGRKRQGETSGSNWPLAFNYSGPDVVRAGDRLRPNRPCPTPRRSEERRVGKESVSTFRSGGSPDHKKKKEY